MSRLDNTLYYYAEVTIEAQSPLVLASGKSGNFFDVELVRDANGLPAIPGTTLAGILRHSFQSEKGEKCAEQIFGYQKENEGNSSSLEVSWAYVHDSKNKYHKSFYTKDNIDKDRILKELYITDNPDFKRDHVHLSDRGVADDTGKFDRYFVPTGCRFTFSIGLWTNGESDAWNDILKILFSSSFRIGAAGRAGYGKIKVIEIKIPKNKYFDLSKDEDINNFRKCNEKYTSQDFKDEVEELKVKLNFLLGFRIGGGTKSFIKNNKHPADMLPYSERVVKWNGDNGDFESEYRITIPGSALKGALRHRAAYHLARINKKWDWDKCEDDG